MATSYLFPLYGPYWFELVLKKVLILFTLEPEHALACQHYILIDCHKIEVISYFVMVSDFLIISASCVNSLE